MIVIVFLKYQQLRAVDKAQRPNKSKKNSEGIQTNRGYTSEKTHQNFLMLKVNNCFRFLFGKQWFVLIMWQLMSALLTGINVINTLLSELNGSTLPLLQLFITYSLLLISHVWHYERSDVSWLPYLVVSVFNIIGDTTSIFAYNTTSLSSAMLLSTTVVFWVTPLSFIFLKRKYSIVQLFSIVFGFMGVVMVFIADGVGDSKWVGNLLAFLAALSYAIANILQEKLVYSASANLYLCRFSIFSMPISGICCAGFEWKIIRNYNWNVRSYLFIFGYAILLAVYYTGIPMIMQFSNATEMNISLLSGNFFSLLISILAFGQKAEWLYLVGFFFIPISITLYALFPYKPKKQLDESNSGEFNQKEDPEEKNSRPVKVYPSNSESSSDV